MYAAMKECIKPIKTPDVNKIGLANQEFMKQTDKLSCFSRVIDLVMQVNNYVSVVRNSSKINLLEKKSLSAYHTLQSFMSSNNLQCTLKH